jgi:serine-type D-Ala-D-Ala carboxypeptidase (penicillin-binding protein 5/6)
VTGATPAIPWVPTGQSAIAVPAAGLLETSGAETPVPIASLTKMMTAYLTLEQHPLTATSSGPKIEMTAVDQADFDQDTVSDASSVEVQAGEVLTERQLLSGLIVRSANNIADTLARWDSGNIPAFVARMNAKAAALGMTSTHYVDTNGLDAGSVSTAHDQLILAEHAMQLPSFASIVDQTTVTLPYIGTLDNYVSAVGSDDVVGIKSGFTDAAMACVVLAAIRQVGNQQVLVLAADLGQPTTLDYAGQEDVSMIDAVSPALHLVEVSQAHQVVGRISQASGGSSWAPVETAAPLIGVAWPGTNVVVSIKEDRVGHSVDAGAVVGSLDASSAGGPPVSVPVVAVDGLRS